jgi:hypothetical protein
MNMKFFFFAGSLILATFAFARIGETLDECKARYTGLESSIGFDEFKFKRGSITVIVHIRNGRSVQEDFAPERGSSLSESDFAELLQENSEGSTWKLLSETPSHMSYTRADGRATAQRARPNISTTNGGNVKLSVQGAELTIKYTAEAINALAPAP